MKLVLLLEGVHNDTGPIEGTPIINSIDPICSSVTLLKGEQNILVDTGYRGYEEEIVSRLEEQGLTPEDILVVFNTHSHFDHCANNHLFTNAKVIYGRGILSPKKWDVASAVEIPGVTIMKTPGHYQDHQSILVKTDRNYVIAGDALREDIIRDEERWKSMNEEYVLSVKRILDVADVVIPGHGRVIQGQLLEELKSVIASRE